MWEQACRKDLRIDHLIPSVIQPGSASWIRSKSTLLEKGLVLLLCLDESIFEKIGVCEM